MPQTSRGNGNGAEQEEEPQDQPLYQHLMRIFLPYTTPGDGFYGDRYSYQWGSSRNGPDSRLEDQRRGADEGYSPRWSCLDLRGRSQAMWRWSSQPPMRQQPEWPRLTPGGSAKIGRMKDTHHIGAVLVAGEHMKRSSSCVAGGKPMGTVKLKICRGVTGRNGELWRMGREGLVWILRRELEGEWEEGRRAEEVAHWVDRRGVWRLPGEEACWSEEVDEGGVEGAADWWWEWTSAWRAGWGVGWQLGGLGRRAGWSTKRRKEDRGREVPNGGANQCTGWGGWASNSMLHTHTVSLSDVRKTLEEWREALLQEYRSLTEVTKAVRPVKRQDLQDRNELEFAPGKLVATIKAASGKKKARVACGNLVEP